MKSDWPILAFSAVAAGCLFIAHGHAWADGRPGSVGWSDGHKVAGAISLTPGKDLRLFLPKGQVAIQLSEVKEIVFKPEKEEMREGFYFPNAGQATQAKTGEVYPTRSLLTQVTLADGKVLEGHLFTTTLYVETDTNTEKVVLMAKQTGTNGQKLTDLVYPTQVHFDNAAVSGGSSQIDLTQTGFDTTHPPVVVAKPDLAFLPLQQISGKSIWTVPTKNSSKLLFSAEAKDGIYVAWPESPFPVSDVDPLAQKAVEAALKTMQDFYDTRTLLGNFAEDDNVYSLVMMKRLGPTNGFEAGRIPWSLVILRWKYDPDDKKATLLNRASLAMGRTEGNSQPPAVFKEPKLLSDISELSTTPPEGHQP